MKPYIYRALALLFLCAPAFAQTTPNLGFNIPSTGSNIGAWGACATAVFHLADHNNTILLPGTPAPRKAQNTFRLVLGKTASPTVLTTEGAQATWVPLSPSNLKALPY